MFIDQLNGSWFWIHDQVLKFNDWTLCYHEFFPDNRKKWNQWIYQWICDIQIIWKLSYVNLLRMIVWTLNYVHYFFSFLSVLIPSIWLKIKPIDLKFYSQISEKHDQTSIFAEGVLQNQSCLSIHLSVCLSVCLWHIFLRIYSVDSLPYILKRRQSHILENCICCLDNWVNKKNLDQKQNIWHFNSGSITFVLKWSPINGYMILWKLHVWKKCGSQFIGQNVLWESDCTIFQTSISQKLSEV